MKSLPRWGHDGKIVGDAKPDTVLSLALDGAVVSKVELFKRQVEVGSQHLKLAGVGGVWTSSGYRRSGCATALLAQAKQLAVNKWGYDGLILFSLEELVPFYAERGYQRHLGLVTMRQPWAVPTSGLSERVTVPDGVAVLTLTPNTWVDPDDPLDIGGLPW